MKFEFYSFAPIEYREKLERLFFFNKEQTLVYPKIEKALEKYGNPKLIDENNKVTIILDKLTDCQNLIIFEENSDEIAGVLLHSRISLKEAEIIHMAIDQKFRDFNIFFKLVDEVINIYRKIKGVNDILITYTKTKIPIKR